MKEFMGREIYPFFFSTSSLRVSADLFTHSSMFLIGISFVSSLNGAVSFGIFLSPFVVFGFLVFGVAFCLELIAVPFGELDAVTAHVLRVALRLDSSPFADLGVSGENGSGSFCCCSLAISLVTRAETYSLICCHMGHFDTALLAVRIHPVG